MYVSAVQKVLVVEDDELIASSLVRALTSKGYLAESARSLAEAEIKKDCDLILCDLTLPDGDGLDFISRMSILGPHVPVIALTARISDSDVVAGLTRGAVDYIAKPFRLEELMARIDAQLRRSNALSQTRSSSIRVGELFIDTESRRVLVGSTEIELRPKEFDLLHRLAASAGKVIRRDDLIKDVWHDNWWGSTKTLNVHVNSLRRKLGEEPHRPSRITSIRGVGYRLETVV